MAQSYYLTGLKFSSVLEAEVETLKAALASFAAQPAAADRSDACVQASVALLFLSWWLLLILHLTLRRVTTLRRRVTTLGRIGTRRVALGRRIRPGLPLRRRVVRRAAKKKVN